MSATDLSGMSLSLTISGIFRSGRWPGERTKRRVDLWMRAGAGAGVGAEAGLELEVEEVDGGIVLDETGDRVGVVIF